MPYLETEKIKEFVTGDRRADCTIRVHAASSYPLPPETAELFEDRLVWAEAEARCTLFCDDAEDEEARRPYAFVRRAGRTAELYFSAEKWQSLSSRVIFELVPVIGWLAEFGAMILHASYIVTKSGGAVLFTAPSGTGKSTQAELWRQYAGAQIVNGDRALLRVTQDGAQAYGIFYCGTSGICKNITAPVRAIVSLAQAEENRIRLLHGKAAFAALLAQCAYDTADARQAELVTATAAQLASAVPVYRLECLPEESAVSCLKEQLEER